MFPLVIVGVDVGSVRRKGGFSWATADARHHGADDPSALGALVASALGDGNSVALAFECPLSVPVPGTGGDEWQMLGRARSGEGNRSWSAGAGTGALATGLVQLAWLCRYLAENCAATPRTTTQLSRFLGGEPELLLAEAMVTSDGKPEPIDGLQDYADALAAAQRLTSLLKEAQVGERDMSDVWCSPHAALNLAATAALHAGLSIELDELRLDVLVAKTRPVIVS